MLLERIGEVCCLELLLPEYFVVWVDRRVEFAGQARGWGGGSGGERESSGRNRNTFLLCFFLFVFTLFFVLFIWRKNIVIPLTTSRFYDSCRRFRVKSENNYYTWLLYILRYT